MDWITQVAATYIVTVLAMYPQHSFIAQNRQRYFIVQPPSTTMLVPVTIWLAGDAR
jgi:hypothetical protein